LIYSFVSLNVQMDRKTNVDVTCYNILLSELKLFCLVLRIQVNSRTGLDMVAKGKIPAPTEHWKTVSHPKRTSFINWLIRLVRGRTSYFSSCTTITISRFRYSRSSCKAADRYGHKNLSADSHDKFNLNPLKWIGDSTCTCGNRRLTHFVNFSSFTWQHSSLFWRNF
jgi:hypothetical protein